MWRLGILGIAGILGTVVPNNTNNRKIVNNDTVITLGMLLTVGTPGTTEILGHKETSK